jgi:hypothetical protein
MVPTQAAPIKAAVQLDDSGGFEDGALASLARREFGRPGLRDVTFEGRPAAPFDLGDTLQAGKFHAQHGGGVLERREINPARGPGGVNERDHPEDVGAGIG